MTLPGFTTCARCGHVAGVMCPHCGKQDTELIEFLFIDGERFRYCYAAGSCYWRTLADLKAAELGEETDLTVDLEPSFTPEEEEMLPLDGDE